MSLRKVFLALFFLLPVSLPAQTQVLHFERSNAQRWMLVEAQVNGRKATFLLDTGATGTVVSPEIVKGLDRNHSSTEVTGLTTKRIVPEVGINLTVGTDHLMLLAKVYTMADVSMNAGRQVDGIIGMNVLNGYSRIVIDNRAQTVTLVK